MKTEYQKLQKTILEFSIENHCVINPDGWHRQIEGYLKHRHCLCDKSRLKCPCDEAPNELKEKGRCLCGLYWSSYETYWFARHFEDALTRVAVVADAQPDASAGDHLPSKKEDDSKSPKLKKFEALLNFREDIEEPASPSNDYIAEAVSLLTDKAGISLENSRRVTIFKDDEGSICVDIVPPQDQPRPKKKDTQSSESLLDDTIETALLEMLSGDNVKTGIDTLMSLAKLRFGTELLWQRVFNFWLRHLVERGDIVSNEHDKWEITDVGRQRLCPSRRKS